MAKQIKMGVVGCGCWGPNLIRNFRTIRDCSLKVMCDISEKRLAHLRPLYPEVEGITDYSHVLNGVGVDAVVIATGVKLHHRMAKASLVAGKHTFIEDPMACSTEECEELVAIARLKGLVLMTGQTFLYSPGVRKIKEMVDLGDLGDLRHITARRLSQRLSGKDFNVAWDLASHDIGVIQHVLGEQPVRVSCQGSAHGTSGIEEVTSICLDFPRQQTAIIQSSWLEPRKVQEMTIVGSRRMVVYDDVAPLEKIRVYGAPVQRPAQDESFADFHHPHHCGDVHVPYLKPEDPLKTQCQHFLDCINQGTTPMTDGNRGLEVVRVLEASSTSLKRGGAWVRLPDPKTGKGRMPPVSEAAARRSTAGIAKPQVSRQAGGNLPLELRAGARRIRPGAAAPPADVSS